MLYILHIYDLMNRIGHCWTHCVCRNPTPSRVTLAFIAPSWLGIQTILVRCAFPLGHWHQRNCSRPTVTNRHDWVFIRPPGISKGAFQLRIDNIGFCKDLLLLSSQLKFETKTDAGIKKHAFAFVSLLEEYKRHRRPGMHVLHILHTVYILHILHLLCILI